MYIATSSQTSLRNRGVTRASDLEPLLKVPFETTRPYCSHERLAVSDDGGGYAAIPLHAKRNKTGNETKRKKERKEKGGTKGEIAMEHILAKQKYQRW